MSDPNDIVGHKTFSDGPLSFRHEPLTRAEADALWEEADRATKERAERMPDETAAVKAMWDAHQRLRELGWRDAIYCPKDGSVFEVIEAGSTGIHDCIYMGEWPKGGWWIVTDGDMSPSEPVLFRLKSPATPNPQTASARHTRGNAHGA